MDIATNMNHVVEYIENHLEDRIESDKLAQIAMCSFYHLSRMFPFLTGITLSEYIRRRKLTMAALALSQSNISVLDVAMKYGYDSPTAFSQAFKKMHGIPPSLAKDKGESLRLYPKLSFQLSLRGDVAMNYRIEKKDSFYITGIKEQLKKVDGDEDFARITQLWAELDERKAAELMKLSNHKFDGLIGVSANSSDAGFDYYIAVTCDGNQSPNALFIPEMEWAVFEIIGALPEAMVAMWKRIFTEWFPNSGYENADAPCLEIYSEGDVLSREYRCEIWVPIQKTKSA